jgi:hypothetical protein
MGSLRGTRAFPLAVTLALAGCAPQGLDEQPVEEVTSALTTNFGNSTPSVLPLQTPSEVNGGDRHSM